MKQQNVPQQVFQNCT